MNYCPKWTCLMVFLAALSGANGRAADDRVPEPTPRSMELASKWGSLSYALPGQTGYPVFQTSEGQKQLGLTVEQKQKIMEIGFEYNAKIAEQRQQRSADWSMRGVKPEDRARVEQEIRARDAKRNQEARGWADEAHKQVEQLLRPEQLAKLKDLEFRQRVPTLLYAPQLLDQVGLDEEQKKKINAIYQETNQKKDEYSRKTMELARQLREAQVEASGRMVDLLRPEQVEKLKELVAKPVPYIHPSPSKLDK